MQPTPEIITTDERVARATREADVTSAQPEPAGGARERVEKWLEKHGVTLEMNVARALRAQLGTSHLNWDVDLGRHYIDDDPETGRAKLRECDVVIRATKGHHGQAWLSTWLTIECKSSKADPWVFYRASDHIDAWAQTLSATAWSVRVGQGLHEKNIAGWGGNTLVMATTRNCYAAASTSDPHKDQSRPNHARDAMMQAISASRGVTLDIPAEDNTAAIVIPVVVTAAPMFAVELTDNGHTVTETTREVVQVRFAPGDDELSKVWVVHSSEVDALAHDFIEVAGALEYWPDTTQ